MKFYVVKYVGEEVDIINSSAVQSDAEIMLKGLRLAYPNAEYSILQKLDL